MTESKITGSEVPWRVFKETDHATDTGNYPWDRHYGVTDTAKTALMAQVTEEVPEEWL